MHDDDDPWYENRSLARTDVQRRRTVLHPQQFGGKPFDLNQMALPGMEDHAMLPNVAHALAKGYTFSSPHDGMVEATAAPDKYGHSAAAGSLEWGEDGDMGTEIDLVWTNTQHRRKGVATAMMESASTGEFGVEPDHSEIRSDLGEKWATSSKVRRLGGNLPERIT